HPARKHYRKQIHDLASFMVESVTRSRTANQVDSAKHMLQNLAIFLQELARAGERVRDRTLETSLKEVMALPSTILTDEIRTQLQSALHVMNPRKVEAPLMSTRDLHSLSLISRLRRRP